MKDIRIGNDISVRWSLYRGDEAYDLTNLPVTLYLKNAYGKREIKDYAIEGNQISWTFFGKDQKNTGKYSMVLVIREGEQGMASTDYCDFVQLVSCACQVSGVDDENVQTEAIELTSEVDFLPIIVDTALSESSLNPIANKAVAEKFAEVEGKMALQPDWNQSDPISKDYIKNRTHGIVFHGDPRKSNYNGFLKSLTNPAIMHVGGNTIATFLTGYHSLYDYDTFLFQLSWYSTTDNILDGIIPTNQSVSVGASTSVVLTFRTFGSVTEDGEFVEHYQTTISFNDSEGLNVDEVISALCEQYCLLINEDFEIAKLDEKYIPDTIARQEEVDFVLDETVALWENVESKVDKVEGKGLSTNDYTNEDKDKLTELSAEKADKNGKYADLTAGDLYGHGESVPAEFSFRASGGKSIKDGTAYVKEIQGNSVVWNQLFNKGVNTNGEVWDNNLITINVETTTAYDKYDNNADAKRGLISHKYLQEVVKVSGAVSQGSIKWYSYAFGGFIVIDSNTPNGVIMQKIGSIIYDNAYWSYRHYETNTIVNGLKIRHIVYDLTQMFGAGNEPTTIEEFYRLLPTNIDINKYNEGEVIPFRAEGIKSVGDNAWDEEWELGTFNTTTGNDVVKSTQIRSKNLIKVLPNAEYHVLVPSALGIDAMWVMLFDSQKKVIEKYNGSGGITSGNSFRIGSNNKIIKTAPNACYMRFYMVDVYGTTYKNDITISLYHSGWKAEVDNTYKPYWADTLMLDARIKEAFPNGMYRAGSAYDVVRYNAETKQMEGVKRIGEVDLGTLSWEAYEVNGNAGFRSRYNSLGAKWNPMANQQSYMCGKYSTINLDLYNSGADKVVALNNNYYASEAVKDVIFIRDTAYTDVASFKASLQGVILYYELAEPIVTPLGEFEMDYKVADFGTEEIIGSEPSAPFNGRTIYQFNAVDQIRENYNEIEKIKAALAKAGITI